MSLPPANEKTQRKAARRALSGAVTLLLAICFAAVQWPVYLLQNLTMPDLPARDAAIGIAAGVLLALVVAILVLALLYARALREVRRSEAARESTGNALRSHRVWLAEMEEKYSAASAASRFQSIFLAHVSNEMRMPINAMLGFSEIIRDEMFGPVGTPRYKGYAQSIHQSAGHLLRSVNNLLDLSRVVADRLELRDRAIELPTLVTQIAKSFEAAVEARGLTFALELQDAMPRLRADPRLLRTMLQALISNAVKFAEKRDAITVRAAVDEAGCIVIAVSDTGPGIAPKDLAEIMEPFGQSASAGKRRLSGLGLGLPLTKSMIELHGGSFELRSMQHQGTTVTLRFPAERSVVGEQSAEAAPAPQVPEAGSSPIAEADASVAAIPQAEPLRNIG